MPAPLNPRTLGLAAAASLAACAVEPGPRAPVEYAEDLAADIPMTGAADPLFAELDTVMRQFVKWRCVGAGTLAISYKGRRVYKRGFGRMHGRASEVLYPGCGDDQSNPFDPDAALTRPDTPLYIGSVTKPVTAAVARWLIGEHLADHPELLPPPCDGPLCSCDDPPCPSTAADVKLLDPAQGLLPPDLAAVIRGDVPLPVQLETRPCAAGHDPKYADPRWRDITLGNLISHQSGLVRDSLSFDTRSGVIGNLAALRSYKDGSPDPWIAEDAEVRAANQAYAPALDAAAAWLSARNLGAPVYFVHGHPPSARRLDETFKLSAGRCLDYTPGVGAKYHEDGLYDTIGVEGEYSNFAITIIGRVIDHIQQGRTGRAYLPEFGQPETHWGSALAEFLAEKLEITEGVETDEGILTRGSYYPFPGVSLPANPIPRIWRDGSYYPLGWDQKAPYCVFRDGACDFSEWLKTNDGDISLRPDLTWSLADDAQGFRRTPLWVEYYYMNNAAGGLISEAPVYLRFANKYNLSGRDNLADNGNGTERVGTLQVSQGHSGSLDGGYAIVRQLAGETRLRSLPPIVDGHLVDEFDDLQQHRLTRPAFVDFVATVNQNNDSRCTARLGETCTNEYAMLGTFVEYGLSLVDWTAVDQLLAAQRDEVVGMTLAADGVSRFWFADDHHVAWTGAPDSFPGRDDPVAAEPYALPSTRIGPDILGVAQDPDGRVVTWYDDGRYSVGSALDLADTAAPLSFAAADDRDPADIAALAIAADGTAHAWYLDGTWSSGAVDDLAARAAGTYELPPDQTPADIEAVAFDPTLPDVVWTRFRDGTTTTGTVARPGTPP